MGSVEFDAACEDIRARIDARVGAASQISEEAATVLFSMLDGIRATLKTNRFVPTRYALSLRLDPAYMGGEERFGDDLPFGTFFVHGRSFNAFHVRFRDISRGGCRVVIREFYAEILLAHMFCVYSLTPL